jgi:DnaK suppressor protein
VAPSPRDRLRTERLAAAERVAALQAELDEIFVAQAADPPDDEHDIEGSSIGFEQAQLRAALARAHDRVAELDDALERANGPDFGRCQTCGGSIGDERLAALPGTRWCVACAGSRSSALRR